jgi:SAM-dependent methyltransferase
MDWNDGYVTDIPYITGAFQVMSPHHLAVACILAGVEPVLPDAPFTYFELGCGDGLTSNILAAANPHASFYAADFMPGHIARAQALAAEARLDNVTFMEASFAELAAGRGDVPRLDFIALHGVYSWISAENRQCIVEFIRRYLRPGGVVYVSYNCMPGWADATPMQRLMQEFADLHAGDSISRVRAARDSVKSLADCGAGYFATTPGMKDRLASLDAENPSYLAHEYLSRSWQPLYHCDVARQLAAAKLDYAGSALLHGLWRSTMPVEQVAAIEACPDRGLHETLKDFMTGNRFRCDIFVRGVQHLTDRRKQSLLEQAGIALIVPPAEATTLLGGDPFGVKVHQHLAQGPCELSSISELLPSSSDASEMLSILSTWLNQKKEVALYWPAKDSVDESPAQRLNRVVARRAGEGDDIEWLASPLLGNAVRLGLVERLTYHRLTAASPPNDPDGVSPDIVTQDVLQLLQARRERGAAAPDAAEAAEQVCKVLDQRAPLWKRLGMF